jgi:acetate kinase
MRARDKVPKALRAKETQAADAALAIDYFVYHVVEFVGAYAAVLGGLGACGFTTGAGKNAAPVGAAIRASLGTRGAKLDDAANARNGPRISTDDSRASIFVILTD